MTYSLSLTVFSTPVENDVHWKFSYFPYACSTARQIWPFDNSRYLRLHRFTVRRMLG